VCLKPLCYTEPHQARRNKCALLLTINKKVKRLICRLP
jgi:hypothetical protein